jgi:hypothetical protein
MVAASARGEEVTSKHARGPLSVAGLSLLALGVGGAGLGVAGLVSLGDTQRLLSLYTAAGAPTSNDAATSQKLEERGTGATVAAAIGWSVAGAGLVGGIILLLVDAPAPVSLALTPVPGGGLISYSLCW